MWTAEAITLQFLISLFAGILSGALIFLVGLRWRLITSFLSRDRVAFRRIFGSRAVESGIITITLDTYRDIRLLSVEDQQRIGIVPSRTASAQEQRFFKIFPDGHWTAFPGAYGDILGYCSARSSGYLVDGLRIPDIIVRVVSDTEVSSRWDGTFVNIGSSASNIKTDQVKHLPENTLLREDMGKFVLANGNEIAMEERTDKGIIFKIANPFFHGYSILVCAGLGEWGTSGAAWFLSTRWRMLGRRFGSNPFLLVVGVTIGTDGSAREILALGEETRLWRIRSWFRARLRRRQ